MSIYNSDYKLDEIISLLKDVKGTLRFIGALGSGMMPLALIMRERGYRISAYDRAMETVSDSSVMERNDASDIGSGIDFCYHTDVDWERVALAVYSLAIDESDGEIHAARSHGIPLISRAQLLGALMSEAKTRISVSGSHGKSTTTAIIDHILTLAGKNHTTVSGARLSSGETYSFGSGDVFLAEACEYKDSFLRLCPTHQIITSVELDHTDYFPSLDAIRRSFLTAARLADTVFVNRDDTVASGIADELKSDSEHCECRVVTYGESEGCDYRFRVVEISGDITRFEIINRNGRYALETTLMGRFNLYNITAAVALSDTLGIDCETVREAIGSFRSIDRRLTKITSISGVPVYYDYAHHPTEISAVITALKERYGAVTVIFRPHTYSRTRSLWNEFIAALSKANFTILLDIYPAREERIDGVDSKALVNVIPNSTYADLSEAADIAAIHPSGAIVLLGAGEVECVRERLVLLGGEEKIIEE